jgi:hypothetical protein
MERLQAPVDIEAMLEQREPGSAVDQAEAAGSMAAAAAAAAAVAAADIAVAVHVEE